MNTPTHHCELDTRWNTTPLIRQKLSKRPEEPMQTQQNTSALRQTASPLSSSDHKYKQQDQPLDGDLSQASGSRPAQNNLETIRDLSTQMDRLRQEYARHAKDMSNLETQVGKSEADCGQMLQNYLELGRAIELKRKHIKDDKLNLARIQRLKEDTSERLDATLTRISALARGDGNAPNAV